MSVASPAGSQPGWKELLALGEQLINHPILSAQRQIILEQVRVTVGGKGNLWLVDPAYPLPGLEGPDFSPPEGNPLVARVLKTHKASRNPSPRGSAGPVVWNIALPLISQGSLLGVLQVERPSDQPLSDYELEFLESLSAHAALAMQVTQQVAIKNWRFEQLALVRSVSFQIANVLDLDELSRRVTNLILNTFQFYYVAIFTVEPDQGHLRLRSSARSMLEEDNRQEQIPAYAIQLGDGIVGSVAQTGEEILASDVSQEPRYRYLDGLAETRSEVAFPLKVGHHVLGVLDAQSNQIDAFHDMDILVLRALADTIALAVEGARLYGTVERRANQIATVAEVSRAINSVLDMDDLLKRVVDLIHDRFEYPYVHIFTVHPGRRKVFFQAGAGSRSQAMQAQEITYDIDDTQGLIPWVAREAKTVLANDVSQDPRYRPNPLAPSGTAAEMALPLLFTGEVLGVLDLQSDQVGAFNAEDQTLFETLADNIAIAIRNASLYRSERWRRQVAESLRDVAVLISSNVALEQMLDSILTELNRNLPCDVAAIWLLQENASDDPEEPGLQLAAVYGSDKESILLVTDLKPDADQRLRQALQADEPIIRSPEDPPGPMGIALGFPQDYSSIAVPLRTGNRTVGLLALAHHTAGRYGSEARAMTTTFASYAAVAIENNRLYASAQEQAWVSTVLLQVSEATQSLTTIEELTSTVVRLMPLLVGVTGCAIFLWDEGITAFDLSAAHSSIGGGQADHLDNIVIFPDEAPAFARLLSEKAPLFIDDPLAEINLPEDLREALGDNPLMLMPLVTRSDVLGAFLITYDDIRPAEDSLGSMDEERLSIIQGIIQQTAVAVENIRLLEAKQEEAYVTAVLLQVAQAVVSLTDLDDILETIVHIMPILVGIDHCAVFLWDADAGFFQGSHVYTVGYQEEDSLLEQTYLPGEFPILDLVHQNDTPLILPLSEPPEPPSSWALIPLPEKKLDQETVLKQKSGILMALPLSVKGNLFGVMLAQDASQAAGFRERRLEIITGISQQAALAIQNDSLQKEMLGRERLDREIQLAREIQQTFLPENLPVLPGWEVDVRWSTARQVGGDFYDVFDLPGNRVGLVIADVSDKGMPAALYMTVTRTLIRASVEEIDSPARVLEHVNDLLVMNSPNGLFVTTFYAVLSLETGKLVYANAGHNLPLRLCSANREIETLLRGGSALGAIGKITLEDHCTQMDPGDCLLLYTDGATESFSPEDELFGEERLQSILQTVIGHSARQVLDAIEDALIDFRRGYPPTDDTTLLSIRRSVPA